MSGKKRKKKTEDVVEDTSIFSGSDSENSSPDDEQKYKEYRLPDYTRYYPEDGGTQFEYIVFMESSIKDNPIGDRDMMSLSNSIKKYNKGVKQLLRMNRYKIGVIFERPTFANAATSNKKFLEFHKLIASIPASATEVTGVINHVPLDISNEGIYSAISSTKNIISVRRFMRRTKIDDKFILQPTKTVSLTFSCPTLPDSVDLNSWRFEVKRYIPPVKQCLRCLRYGHIAKYCKNSDRCSICGSNHNFKNCTIKSQEATCCHCKGNHIAISPDCPVKKEKIEENKNKFNTRTYAQAFNEKSFPPLGKNNKLSPSEQFQSLLNSDQVLNALLTTIVKLITDNKKNESSICTENIKSVLLETLKNSK